MKDWEQGYNTETDYIYGFYRELAPSYIRTIGRLQGLAVPEGRLTYLELGCGQGLGPNLLAAANPHDRFIGVDFAPEHILGARRLAQAAKLTNVTFEEDSFETLAEQSDCLPDCDIIVLHGIYSWIGPAQREAVRSIIRRKLKTGGLLYLSYNCAAGWGPVANFQKVLRDLVISRGGGFRQTAFVLARLKSLRDNDFGFFKNSLALSDMLDQVTKHNPNYVHHEYMHVNWNPFHFQDVAEEMASCKLTFVGSGNPVDNPSNLTFSPELAKIVDEEPSITMRESLKDLHCARRFRKDIYVRGAVRLPADEWANALKQTPFAMIAPRRAIKMVARIPRGEIKLGKVLYRNVFDLLEQGPAPLGQLVQNASELRDVLTVLIQIGAIHPAETGPLDGDPTRRLNIAMTSSTSNLMRYGYCAAPAIGSALPISRHLAPTFAACLRGKIDENNVKAETERLRGDGSYSPFYKAVPNADQPLDDDQSLLDQLQIWRQLGVVA